MDVITEFLAGGTVKVWAYVYDDTGVLADPTSITVTIIKPDGTTKAVNAEAMTPSATGIYYYYYRTASNATKGHYSGEVDIADGSGGTAVVTPVPFSFEIK